MEKSLKRWEKCKIKLINVGKMVKSFTKIDDSIIFYIILKQKKG